MKAPQLIFLFLVVIAQSAAADIVSGGLGLSKQAWEAKQGKPDAKCPIPSSTCYGEGKYVVDYMFSHIWGLRIYIHPLLSAGNARGGIGVGESRSLAKSFIPSDGRLIKTYKNRSGSTVDLYMSETLKSLESHFPASNSAVWGGGEVGNFIVIHSGINAINSVVIGTGNNP